MEAPTVFKSAILLLAVSFQANDAQSQSSDMPGNQNPTGAYFGQRSPDTIPEVFAPEFISKEDRYEFGCTMSAAGDEFYFGIDIDGKPEIHFTTLEAGTWTAPRPLLVHEIYGFNDPMLSPNEDKLYFISTSSLDQAGPAKDPDIWYMDRTDTGWGAPINAGSVINSDKKDFYISFTKEGTLYFGSNINSAEDRPFDYDIYRSKQKDGVYQQPERLPAPINTKWYELDVFISPDESYMIFAASWKEGLGQGDLYISFSDFENGWTVPKNMGSPINDELHQLCPFVSADGKYLFFTSDKDIYWVEASVIDNYRN